MSDRTAEDRVNMITTEMLRRQQEASDLRGQLRALSRRFEKAEARYLEADTERVQLALRADKAEEEAKAFREENQVLIGAGLLMPTDSEEFDLNTLAKGWLDEARRYGEDDDNELNAQADIYRECAAALLRVLKKRQG